MRGAYGGLFPPQPESPQDEAAEGEGERAPDVAVEDVEEGEKYGPSESELARMYEDAEPDVYVGMDVDPANAPLLPMPTAVAPPPLRSCEQRHCRFDAAEDVHQRRLSDEGRREAMLLVGASERYKCQPPGWVARERGLEAVPPDDAASNWGTQRSWITTQVRSRQLSRRKTSPCRCACR